jgi:hypothetical protein
MLFLVYFLFIPPAEFPRKPTGALREHLTIEADNRNVAQSKIVERILLDVSYLFSYFQSSPISYLCSRHPPACPPSHAASFQLPLLGGGTLRIKLLTTPDPIRKPHARVLTELPGPCEAWRAKTI